MLYWRQKYGTLCNTNYTTENSPFLLFNLSAAAAFVNSLNSLKLYTQDDWSVCRAVSDRALRDTNSPNSPLPKKFEMSNVDDFPGIPLERVVNIGHKKRATEVALYQSLEK